MQVYARMSHTLPPHRARCGLAHTHYTRLDALPRTANVVHIGADVVDVEVPYRFVVTATDVAGGTATEEVVVRRTAHVVPMIAIDAPSRITLQPGTTLDIGVSVISPACAAASPIEWVLQWRVVSWPAFPVDRTAFSPRLRVAANDMVPGVDYTVTVTATAAFDPLSTATARPITLRVAEGGIGVVIVGGSRTIEERQRLELTARVIGTSREENATVLQWKCTR